MRKLFKVLEAARFHLAAVFGNYLAGKSGARVGDSRNLGVD